MYNEKATALFMDWDEALIWSCLQGYRGTMIVDDARDPQSAIIDIGDFCFCAGKPNEKLLKSISICDFKLITPRNEYWQTLIEQVFAEKAKKILRYAIKKESDVFDAEKLESYVSSLDNDYEIKLFDGEIFRSALSES